jgi:hypothetical protein
MFYNIYNAKRAFFQDICSISPKFSPKFSISRRNDGILLSKGIAERYFLYVCSINRQQGKKYVFKKESGSYMPVYVFLYTPFRSNAQLCLSGKSGVLYPGTSRNKGPVQPPVGGQAIYTQRGYGEDQRDIEFGK